MNNLLRIQAAIAILIGCFLLMAFVQISIPEDISEGFFEDIKKLIADDVINIQDGGDYDIYYDRISGAFSGNAEDGKLNVQPDPLMEQKASADMYSADLRLLVDNNLFSLDDVIQQKIPNYVNTAKGKKVLDRFGEENGFVLQFQVALKQDLMSQDAKSVSCGIFSHETDKSLLELTLHADGNVCLSVVSENGALVKQCEILEGIDLRDPMEFTFLTDSGIATVLNNGDFILSLKTPDLPLGYWGLFANSSDMSANEIECSFSNIRIITKY